MNEKAIRVGELEWDLYKDWRGKDFYVVEDTILYGIDIRIYLAFHPNRTVSDITFGYFKDHEDTKEIEFIAHGPTRYYDLKGNLVAKRNFVEGLAEGKFEDYHFNGYVSASGTFKAGKLEGDYYTFYVDAELQCKMYFENDLEEGEQLCYHRNGTIASKVFFSKGVVDGSDSSWYDNGALEATYLFINGAEQDTGRHIHKNGEPFTERVFVDGKLSEILYLKDKSGKDLDPGDFKNGNGRLNIYSDDGNLTEIVTYQNGFVKKIRYLD